MVAITSTYAWILWRDTSNSCSDILKTGISEKRLNNRPFQNQPTHDGQHS